MSLFHQNNYINFKTIATTLVATIITVGAGIWVTRLVGPVPLSVQQTLTQKEQTFNVTGESEIAAIPDQAEISLGVEVVRNQVADAQTAVNEINNNIIQALKDQGVAEKDIKTTNYSVNPEYDFESPGRQISGYRANAQLRVKLSDFEKVNQVIDTATGLGANQVHGISFTLSEDLEKDLVKQAREEAINDAKQDAEELARLSGIRLGKIINVIESQQNGQPIPFLANERAIGMGDMAMDSSTQIEPGSSTFNYQVTLSYETL